MTDTVMDEKLVTNACSTVQGCHRPMAEEVLKLRRSGGGVGWGWCLEAFLPQDNENHAKTTLMPQALICEQRERPGTEPSEMIN